MKASLNIEPAKASKFLLTLIFFLFVGNCLYLFTRFVYGYSYRHPFTLFNFDAEANIPTFYSVCAILMAALFLFIIGFVKKKQKVKDGNFWLALGGIFVFLSYDEAAKVHESLTFTTRGYLPESSMDFLYWAWVVPYAIFIIVVVSAFAGFLWRLPRKTAYLFVAAGSIFVSGAVGMELLNSYFYINEGQESLGLSIVTTIEELMEMLGIVLFIHAILSYIKLHLGQEIEISFKKPVIVSHVNQGQAYLNEEEIV